jgi:hypothetical protein
MNPTSAKDLIVSSLQSVCGQGACGPASLTGIAGAIANILIFITGATAVIMIIIGGLKYVLSMGNAKQVESAKNTILYSVIGIVISISSYAMVNFVLTAFRK